MNIYNHILQAKNDGNKLLAVLIDPDKFQLKNVCAKLPNWLVEELEEVCSVLSMSKRDFIENAIIDSIESFNAIAEEHDIFAPHTPNSFTEEK